MTVSIHCHNIRVWLQPSTVSAGATLVMAPGAMPAALLLWC